MAADQIFPIVFKPGILRDRPPFQGEFCTDGSWIRFYGGMPRKIGGMYGIYPAAQYTLTNNFYINNVGNKEYTVFFGYIYNNNSSVASVTVNDNVITNIKNHEINKNNFLLWQFIPVITNTNAISDKNYLLCFGSNNLNNILDSSEPSVSFINLKTNTIMDINFPVSKDTNSGAVFINPYLFIYGDSGLVMYFEIDKFIKKEAGLSISISTDKVIFGAKVRGGNSPTLLFWTLSSVIKVSNTGGGVIAFTKDVISSDSSIISSRCVVEYDGIFYWPGTGRFFSYNGLVNPLDNNINRNYFFNNLDMNKRQLVFGVKNVAKDEIWWFYPEKGKAADVGCTHAIIHNVIENSWYDTPIERNCGFWDNVTGTMFTFGKSLTDPTKDGYLFKHEVGVNEILQNNGVVNNPISSFFTTPTVSFAAFNPLKQLTGVDRWMQIKKIEPDFKMDNPEGNMEVVINTKQYAQSVTVSSDPVIFTGETPKIDYYYQGRQVTFTFGSEVYFEMGHVMITVNLGDGQ